MNTHKIKKLLVLTSGGDAPGMNAALRAVVRTALHYNLEVYGTEAGYVGLVEQKIFPLGSESVANIVQRGGTVLKTGRCPEFLKLPVRDRIREFLRQHHIDAMIVLGGDGSFAGAALLELEEGPKVIGIPCTIDNDIQGTDYCIGFDTACNTALEAIDKIRDTAFSLDRNFLIEVMGRSSGFIAVEVGIAGGAEVIVIPEFPLSAEKIVKKLAKEKRQKLASIIVVAESGSPGYSMELAKQIESLSGVQYRVCILGHTQRGGSPTVKDRQMAAVMGVKAVEALLAGHSMHMIAAQKGTILPIPFSNPEHATRYFNDNELLRLNEVICDV